MAGSPASSSASVVDWAWYVDGHRQDCEDLEHAGEQAQAGNGFVWLGLFEPSDTDMEGFAERFSLHPLAIEDAVEGHTRSKLEHFGDTLFVVASTVRYVEHDRLSASSEVVRTGQVMIFHGEHFVMTVRRGEHGHLRELRARLEAEPERLALGPTAVLYGVLDTVIDHYLEVVTAFEDDVDAVEEEVFSPTTSNDVSRAYQLKRELIELKRAVTPLGPALQALAGKAELELPDRSRAYFRELADHHLEAKESIASFDEVLTSILQFAQARASNDDNADMRRLSAWVAMVAVPTLIAGIYGMNFAWMPGLTWRYGYFVALAVMGLVVVGLYLGFKRRRWL